MRIISGLILGTLLLCLLGCETGESKHNVDTDTNGTLEGLLLRPEPQSFDVDQYTDFWLDWEPGYPPPRQFQVSLRRIDNDGHTTALYTELETIDIGHYRLDPTSVLPAQTFLLLTVTGAGQTTRAIYLTGGSVTDDDDSSYGKSAGPGQAEHTVQVRPPH